MNQRILHLLLLSYSSYIATASSKNEYAFSQSENLESCSICGEGKILDMTATDNFEVISFEKNIDTTCEEAQQYASNFSVNSSLCKSFRAYTASHCQCTNVTSSPSLVSSSSTSMTKLSSFPTSISSTQRYKPSSQSSTTMPTSAILYASQNQKIMESLHPSQTQSFQPTITASSTNPSYSISPSITAKPSLSMKPTVSNIPSISESPSTSISENPTIFSSIHPSTKPSISNEPTLSSSPSVSTNPTTSQYPSALPSQLPSHYPSTNPSKLLSLNPTFYPTASPLPSIQLSDYPSSKPSHTLSSAPSSTPSIQPSSFFDRAVNCTAIEKGILPNAEFLNHEKMSTLESMYNLNVTIRYDGELNEEFFEEIILFDLQSIFRNLMSMSFITSCSDDKTKGKRKVQSIFGSESQDIDVLHNEGIKIFLIDFLDLKRKDDQSSCANYNNTLGVTCYVVEGRFEIFYSTLDDSQPITVNLVKIVFDSLKSKLKDIPSEIHSIESLSIISTTKTDTNSTVDFGNPLSPSNQVVIVVAAVCSLLVVVAIVIISRGRRRTNNHSQRAEMTRTGPDPFIRSDDSVSNSPTMSSGARGNGWDDAGRSEVGSQSDATSDASSRPSFTVQLEEASHASHGIEASRGSLYHSGYSNYLPSSVLKDLLDGNGRNKSFDFLDAVDV